LEQNPRKVSVLYACSIFVRLVNNLAVVFKSGVFTIFTTGNINNSYF
jgi:hypothetical protein